MEWKAVKGEPDHMEEVATAYMYVHPASIIRVKFTDSMESNSSLIRSNSANYYIDPSIRNRYSSIKS